MKNQTLAISRMGTNQRGRALLIVIPIVLLIAAAGVAWWLLFSPRAQIKRHVNDMVSAFEQEDVNRLMLHFSSDYRDGAGLVKQDVDDFLVFFFETREDMKVSLKGNRLLLHGEKADVFLTGTISYTTRAGSQSFKIENLLLRFEREKGGWRVASVENAGAFVE